MKQVNHLAIIAQPALVDGVTVNCPHCNEPTQVREDGSLYCLGGGISFAPESTDGELFTMRQDFDARNGISLSQRLLMVPRMLVTSGFDPEGNGRFNPELADALERFAMGGMLSGGLNRVYA
jgi:hypothetical protein